MRKVSFYDYIMATRLDDPEKNYYTDFARILYGFFYTKQQEAEFTPSLWAWFVFQMPEFSKYNKAVFDLWSEYVATPADATLEQIMVPYYSTQGRPRQ